MRRKHLARYDTSLGAYNGWRFCIRRLGLTLVRYFSDLEHGGAANAKREALAYRDRVYAQLAAHPENAADVLRRFNEELRQERRAHELPGHLHSANHSGRPRKSLTLRITPPLDEMLRSAEQQLGVDASSVIRLALYHYFPLLRRISNPLSPAELQAHLEELETLATSLGLPTFEELMVKTKLSSIQKDEQREE